MKTKIDVISGFLGAGKTTLIKKLIEEKLNSEKLVLIENEFGEIGIDGSILKESNIEVQEINSGCICCTLVGDFEKAIDEIVAKYNPNRIIIEPSGVGKLSDVIKAVESSRLRDKLIINMLVTVVDVLKYQIYSVNFSEFFENQIQYASTIILSRTQKADSKKMEFAFNAIRQLNNQSNIVTTPWEELSAECLIAVAEQDKVISLEHQLNHIQHPASGSHVHSEDCNYGCHDSHSANYHSHNHHADEVFDVWGAETPRMFDISELKSIVNDLAQNHYGVVLRGKGILQVGKDKWVQFDYVPGEVEFKDASPDYSGRICVIGKNLSKGELGKLFDVMT
ncbi:MAG: GTP-binding protein [Thermincola sp.]|jgi:G3E family GTPase|nr:GTP-binding protein [Thermincola sp.]MDT3703126.1 GTP-binding protein [Thermincola sp.]